MCRFGVLKALFLVLLHMRTRVRVENGLVFLKFCLNVHQIWGQGPQDVFFQLQITVKMKYYTFEQMVSPRN